MMADRLGQQLGNYRLIRLLGEGGFAEVYLGEHIHLGTQAAIKVLYTQLTSENIEVFRTEARNLAHLIHPHIVRVLEFGVEGKTPFLVMDYAPNGTLRQRHRVGTPVPLAMIVSYVKQVADALQYAHNQKLIHRDIKPENMLLGRNSEVLLSDFGIAVVAQSSRYQNMQDMAGTIAYMAPEQIQAHPRPASDQYALGVVVYEWLSGDRPFHGSFTEVAAKHTLVPPPSLREKIPTISPDVEHVVMMALAKDPKDRFMNIQAFATALEQASMSTFISPQMYGGTIPSPGPFNIPAPVPQSTTPPTVPASTSSPILPPTTPYGSMPGIYYQQPPAQPGQTVGLAQIPQTKKTPNLALILGTSFILLVLIISGIFLFNKNPGNINSTGNTGGTNPGGSTATSSSGNAINGNNGKGCKQIGVLLPETATSARWDSKDKPLLESDISNALPGATVDYYNAGGSADQQQTQADAALTKGDCILVVAANDSLKAARIVTDAKADNVPVIGYDRLIQSSDLTDYVSFDNVKVGELQGQYIVDHYRNFVHAGSIGNVVIINGSRTDNNALLFSKGAHTRLDPLFNSGVLRNVYEQFTPNWDNPTAQTEMEAALTANSNNIQIAYVANDGMASTVIAALKTANLNGRVLVTGQDATIAGLQNILLGDQAMTVYKSISQEAMATANLIAAISNGTSTSTLINGTAQTQDGSNIPSVLVTPIAVDKTNIQTTVVADGWVSIQDICQGLPSGTGGICP